MGLWVGARVEHIAYLRLGIGIGLSVRARARQRVRGRVEVQLVTFTHAIRHQQVKGAVLPRSFLRTLAARMRRTHAHTSLTSTAPRSPRRSVSLPAPCLERLTRASAVFAGSLKRGDNSADPYQKFHKLKRIDLDLRPSDKYAHTPHTDSRTRGSGDHHRPTVTHASRTPHTNS